MKITVKRLRELISECLNEQDIDWDADDALVNDQLSDDLIYALSIISANAHHGYPTFVGLEHSLNNEISQRNVDQLLRRSLIEIDPPGLPMGAIIATENGRQAYEDATGTDFAGE